MFINTYNDLRDEEGNLIPKRKALTIKNVDIKENGEFDSYTCSNSGYAESPSLILIIDDNTAEQLEKLKLTFDDGHYKLALKDGEEFTYPVETEQEKQIRELKEQLAALQAAQEQGE